MKLRELHSRAAQLKQINVAYVIKVVKADVCPVFERSVI